MDKENWNLELSTYIKEGDLSEIEKLKHGKWRLVFKR